jgi:hypothetical protein
MRSLFLLFFSRTGGACQQEAAILGLHRPISSQFTTVLFGMGTFPHLLISKCQFVLLRRLTTVSSTYRYCTRELLVPLFLNGLISTFRRIAITVTDQIRHGAFFSTFLAYGLRYGFLKYPKPRRQQPCNPAGSRALLTSRQRRDDA